jgi:hypothetical protein
VEAVCWESGARADANRGPWPGALDCPEAALSVQLAAKQAPGVFDVKEELPAAQPMPKEEPKAKDEAPAIVSKWSLVDYDEDDDNAARWRSYTLLSCAHGVRNIGTFRCTMALSCLAIMLYPQLKWLQNLSPFLCVRGCHR